VYVANKSTLKEFLESRGRSREELFKDRVVDATISFRFYVQKGELRLPKGGKGAMLGF
jgi:hypothetical protein